MLPTIARTRRHICPVVLKRHTSTTGRIGHGSRGQMTEVSKTYGAPSTSTDLKEALCEKIPLHYDLLRKFRRKYGSSVVSHVTVDDLYGGLKGVRTMVRETSEIDPKVGVKYRGLSIPEVVGLLPRRGISPSPEAVFWLLLTGDIPTYEQTASLTADWTSRRQKLKERWCEKGGGTIGAVLETLPKTVSPLGKFSIALTVLGADKNMRKALKSGVMSYAHWEYAFEDSMELLAALPAIVGLVSKTRDLRDVNTEGDSVDFLVDCLWHTKTTKTAPGLGNKSVIGDFLRLYITINADEDSGSPGAHVTQILGDAKLDPSQALASGFLGYANEPKSGSMLQYMKLQSEIRQLLGKEPTETVVRNYLRSAIDRNEVISGYEKSDICDPRYLILRDYAEKHLPQAPEVKLSQKISKHVVPMMKQSRGEHFWPEPTAIAGPIFQEYGMLDMEFNQVLLSMSRALGSIASIVWARAIDAPVERPRSCSTHTYMKALNVFEKKPRNLPTK